MALKALIIGGGIGGLAAALALDRRGIEVEIFEQAAEPDAAGASLSIGPNAVRLLDELGIGEALRRVGAVPDTVDLLRWSDGSLLHRTSLGPAMEERFGAPQLDFFRPDLQRVMIEAVPEGSLHLGARVTEVRQEDGRAFVALDDGTEVGGDLVVAADGIRSPVRRHLFGPEDPVFSGTVVYRGVVPRADVADLHPPRANMYWLGPQRHGVSYWLSHGERLAVTLATREADWSRESWTLEASAAEALAFVDGWDESFRTRLSLCETMLRSAVFIREPIERWSSGRITLLGDAAHAMAPFQAQGSAQAIEDAFVLGACLGDGSDTVTAIKRYEAIRLSHAAELQGSSQSAAESFYLPDGDEQRARDAAYASLQERQPWGPRQELWDYDVRAELAET
jgi:2-polyprenyl-6-methoxyphenol hydroxylase-like FAD-dependent oxidoreductase